jgi:ERCC4-type nuclease
VRKRAALDQEEIHSCIVVLDCIVERKTINDLASSIVDGRYEEQKGRLKGCGVFNCVYLVEGASLNPQGVRGRGKTGAEQDRSGGASINTNSIITALAATQVLRSFLAFPPSVSHTPYLALWQAVGVATGMCRQEAEAEEALDEESKGESESEGYSFHVVNTRGLDHTATHLLCLHR